MATAFQKNAFQNNAFQIEISEEEVQAIHRGKVIIPPAPIALPPQMVPSLMAQLVSVIENQPVLRRRQLIPEAPEPYDIELSMKDPNQMTQSEFEKWRRQNPKL